jgi:hypothetical protein
MDCTAMRTGVKGTKFMCRTPLVKGIEVIVAKGELYTTLRRIDRCPSCNTLCEYTVQTPSKGLYSALRG